MCCFSQEVISTQGGSNSNSAGSLDYSIGEVVITFGTNDTTHLTQGFQQPFFEITNIETFEISFDVLIYPNPAVDQLTIEFQEILNGSKLILPFSSTIFKKSVTSIFFSLNFSVISIEVNGVANILHLSLGHKCAIAPI